MESRGALSIPAFRMLWAAGLVSDTGDWLLLIALPIVVYSSPGRHWARRRRSPPSWRRAWCWRRWGAGWPIASTAARC